VTFSSRQFWFCVGVLVLLSPFSAGAREFPVQATLRHLEQLQRAIDEHEKSTGELPRDSEHLGIIARLRAPGVPIRDGVATDGWGSAYLYRLLEPGSQLRYEIYSAGKNGADEAGGGDDIVSRDTLDVAFYPEVYAPALQLFPIVTLLVIVPIVWAVIRATRQGVG
jgi:hypothetical protein